ncbi:phage terminase large subunit family protein [Candidatus Roseilinea sp. NK_OTU-006]|jgi:phage terminase large subunit GpA-like protein|uniref:phage terminase large subunit family protein n=1 Tax=Candidatus Roseilinea sp. NK_OTU-006 TaxID=2704250 RepID=UPI0019801ED5|nr:phage terminase large subunit family protein [Candidatus Roseilinea sp. NK_OTU-006]
MCSGRSALELLPSAASLLADVAQVLLPPERVSLWQWADRHRRLSSEASAAPGAWTTLPYQRDVLDALSPHSRHERVVLVWGSQLGKTEMLLTLIAYIIACQPGPILVVQPTLSMAEAFSKDRISPMVRDMEVLRGLVADPKARDAGSTIFHRRFVGGHLTIVGSNSPAGLASRPIRYLLMDEVDRWEASAGAEGDPATLAIARTRTFWNRKIVMVSSPTVRGASRIEQAWLESDQREYHVPCPHCGQFQRLVWARVEWPDGKPREAQYRCASCERLIHHSQKARMIAQGRWEPGNPGSAIAGFHLSELYSPWRSWGELAAEWLAAQGNVERLRAFVNTSLAELWDDQVVGQVSEDELLARRENYGPQLPDGVALLTAGVDVQDDRLECSVWGWGRSEESWLIEHRIIPGDPTLGPEQGPWLELDRYLTQPWPHPRAGALHVAAAAIDAGYATAVVTRFCDARAGRRIWAVKGAGGSVPAWPRRQSRSQRGRLFVIGVDSLKASIIGRLRTSDGPGAMHFPVTVEREYFEQLNAEFVKTTYSRGRPVRVWERRKGCRAEALDCAVYAYAALHGLMHHGVHLDREAERLSLLASPRLQQSMPAGTWLGDRPKGWLRR